MLQINAPFLMLNITKIDIYLITNAVSYIAHHTVSITL